MMKKLSISLFILSILLISSGFATACVYNGVTYSDGEQVKMVNGCYSTVTGESCSTNYQFTTCSAGVWYGMSICYPGEGCGLQQTTSETASNGQNRDNFGLFLAIVVIIISVGLATIIYFNYVKKPNRKKKR